MTYYQERHTAAGHELPISNGFSGGGVPGAPFVFTVWCGRCRADFRIDEAYLDRYYEARPDDGSKRHYLAMMAGDTAYATSTKE